MSETQDPHGSEEGLIKTPKQLIVTVVASFLVPILVIVLLRGAAVRRDGLTAGGRWCQW